MCIENISDSILVEISNFNKELDEEKEKKLVQKVEKKPKKKNKCRGGERILRDQILELEIFEDDDELTKLIKNQLNENVVTMDYIYERSNSSKGYNLYYGLSTRNSMTWKTFCIWCELLDLNYEINLTKK